MTPPDNSSDPSVTPASSRAASRALLAIAVVALGCELLFNCPRRFSEEHIKDTSMLRHIVDFLGLWGKWPTVRGVEIRNLIFFLGAAAMTLVAGMRLALYPRESRLTADDLLDLRRRLASPFAWWITLLAVSALSSIFSHAPQTCLGQMAIRAFYFAWWVSLASLLEPSDARRLAGWVVAALAITATIGLWYHSARVLPHLPDARLQYPIGNELWLAACLLPGLFLSAGLIFGSMNRPIRWLTIGLSLIAGIAIAVALDWTRSRSAITGIAMGVAAAAVFMVPVRWRRQTVLGIALAGVAVVLLVQQRFADGKSLSRGHSIRSRILYEWPYALRLFFEKPVGGHGDGAYSLLAGQLAREDQIDDPAIMRFDQSNWTGHAHNEYLELLADLGLVGAIAFLAAMATTLYHALRFVDQSRDDPEQRSCRWMVIFLSAALIAMAVEQFGTPALREPGMPPVFLTVWACLWALVRGQVRVVSAGKGDPINSGMSRTAGFAICFGAAVLSYLAVYDWRASRARLKAEEALLDKDYARAAALADFSGAHRLDPFQSCQARMQAIWARSLDFDSRLAMSNEPTSNDDLKIGKRALDDIDRLKHDAPRFLRVSRLESEVSLNLSRAFERRGETLDAARLQGRFLVALEQSRQDEPFMIERVQALWQSKSSANPGERINWMRCLLRNGEIQPGFLELFRRFERVPGFLNALDAMLTIAAQDKSLPADRWGDRLSPETFRLAALTSALSGKHAQAIAQAQDAVAMYDAAGARLFLGKAATLHEIVRYRFDLDPAADTDLNLTTLAEAQGVMDTPVGNDVPLIAPMGETRLGILLAAGRETDAEKQLTRLQPDDKRDAAQRLASAYANLALMYASSGQHLALAEKWCLRAAELVRGFDAPSGILTQIRLQKGDVAGALTSAQAFLDLSGSSDDAVNYLLNLRQRFPNSDIWPELAKKSVRLRSATSQSTSAESP